MSQRIVIRADASSDIGSGHVVRCLTLADGLKQHGATLEFICRDEPGHLAALIQNRGYRVSLIPDTQNDLDFTRGILSQAPASWLVVDNYRLGHAWETPLRPHLGRIMAIDDLANRYHDADILLDQNEVEQGKARYDGLVPPHCRRFQGARYALLTPDFQDYRPAVPAHDGCIRKILVYFGGADQNQLTMQSLAALEGTEVRITALVGWQNQDIDAIKSWCSTRASIEFSLPVRNMAELVAAYDLIIGAGGTTTWERCALGKPALVVTVASNQEALTAHLASRGAVLWLGRKEEFSAIGLRSAIDALMANPSLVQRMAKAAYRMTDGAGLARIVAEIMRPPLHLRPARGADCELLYQWRNHPKTRRYFFNPEEISSESHRQWFNAAIGDPMRLLLIGEANDKPIGAVRYDIDGQAAEVSVYLDPECHGRGWGTALLLAGNGFLHGHDSKLRSLHAKVLVENKTSSGAFLAAGYRPWREEYVCTLRKTPQDQGRGAP